MTNHLVTDYLIIGSGAMGMAFADILLTETDYDMIIVDKHHKPGGHWNDAYSFVTLHQPSAFYGVSSKELSKGRRDETGLNKGLGDLATGPEILSYFDELMRQRFLTSGRVRYFPMCEYQESDDGGKIASLTSDTVFTVEARYKTVDATYLKTAVPSTHVPSFSVDARAWFIPLNELPNLSSKPSEYVIIGGGKTAIDAVLWLLAHHVRPEKIVWIRPNDFWMTDRLHAQPDEAFFADSMGAQARQMEALAQATSLDDLFDRFEAAGVFVRIDQDVRPRGYRGATVSQAELSELRRVKRVIRLGRVREITPEKIVLDEGALKTRPETLLIDCSASAVTNMEITPVFQGDTIRLQTVRSIQPVFSAAFIAHVEAAYSDEETKQKLCNVVPLPKEDNDWLRMQEAFMMNQFNWSQDKDLRVWLRDNRLDGFSQLVRNVSPDDTEKMEILSRLRENMLPAMTNLQKLISELD